eukprot:405649-Hanusia_phi.AAC.1
MSIIRVESVIRLARDHAAARRAPARRTAAVPWQESDRRPQCGAARPLRGVRVPVSAPGRAIRLGYDPG